MAGAAPPSASLARAEAPQPLACVTACVPETLSATPPSESLPSPEGSEEGRPFLSPFLERAARASARMRKGGIAGAGNGRAEKAAKAEEAYSIEGEYDAMPKQQQRTPNPR